MNRPLNPCESHWVNANCFWMTLNAFYDFCDFTVAPLASCGSTRQFTPPQAEGSPAVLHFKCLPEMSLLSFPNALGA